MSLEQRFARVVFFVTTFLLLLLLFASPSFATNDNSHYNKGHFQYTANDILPTIYDTLYITQPVWAIEENGSHNYQFDKIQLERINLNITIITNHSRVDSFYVTKNLPQQRHPSLFVEFYQFIISSIQDILSWATSSSFFSPAATDDFPVFAHTPIDIPLPQGMIQLLKDLHYSADQLITFEISGTAEFKIQNLNDCSKENIDTCLAFQKAVQNILPTTLSFTNTSIQKSAIQHSLDNEEDSIDDTHNDNLNIILPHILHYNTHKDTFIILTHSLPTNKLLSSNSKQALIDNHTKDEYNVFQSQQGNTLAIDEGIILPNITNVHSRILQNNQTFYTILNVTSTLLQSANIPVDLDPLTYKTQYPREYGIIQDLLNMTMTMSVFFEGINVNEPNYNHWQHKKSSEIVKKYDDAGLKESDDIKQALTFVSFHGYNSLELDALNFGFDVTNNDAYIGAPKAHFILPLWYDTKVNGPEIYTTDDPTKSAVKSSTTNNFNNTWYAESFTYNRGLNQMYHNAKQNKYKYYPDEYIYGPSRYISIIQPLQPFLYTSKDPKHVAARDHPQAFKLHVYFTFKNDTFVFPTIHYEESILWNNIHQHFNPDVVTVSPLPLYQLRDVQIQQQQQKQQDIIPTPTIHPLIVKDLPAVLGKTTLDVQFPPTMWDNPPNISRMVYQSYGHHVTLSAWNTPYCMGYWVEEVCNIEAICKTINVNGQSQQQCIDKEVCEFITHEDQTIQIQPQTTQCNQYQCIVDVTYNNQTNGNGNDDNDNDQSEQKVFNLQKTTTKHMITKGLSCVDISRYNSFINQKKYNHYSYSIAFDYRGTFDSKKNGKYKSKNPSSGDALYRPKKAMTRTITGQPLYEDNLRDTRLEKTFKIIQSQSITLYDNTNTVVGFAEMGGIWGTHPKRIDINLIIGLVFGLTFGIIPLLAVFIPWCCEVEKKRDDDRCLKYWCCCVCLDAAFCCAPRIATCCAPCLDCCDVCFYCDCCDKGGCCECCGCEDDITPIPGPGSDCGVKTAAAAEIVIDADAAPLTPFQQRQLKAQKRRENRRIRKGLPDPNAPPTVPEEQPVEANALAMEEAAIAKHAAAAEIPVENRGEVSSYMNNTGIQQDTNGTVVVEMTSTALYNPSLLDDNNNPEIEIQINNTNTPNHDD